LGEYSGMLLWEMRDLKKMKKYWQKFHQLSENLSSISPALCAVFVSPYDSLKVDHRKQSMFEGLPFKDCLPINIACPQVTYPHRSEKLSVPRMIVAEAPLTRRYFITNAVHTVPSFSYNRPVQLKHATNHVLTRVLIQAMNVDYLLSRETSTTKRILAKFKPSECC
ncbi:hypothetical protein ACTXT7_016673, partial [Hymenolepis weldensis]